ncbi:cell wall cysteine-rich protein [Colletotrichum kahawae]|uniref:Cell wall cysteine-rich protein n=1 Tax=Colletotrichum kahawae TaxID=34407 RepID=A0AAD9Y233_COLKA|nr:cell wall cysteine-rich protein [Colletotrichum kahawae]
MNANMTLSAGSSTPIEDVAEVREKSERSPPLWVQLYLQTDVSKSVQWIKRAEAAGCTALVLTVDTPILGNRLSERRGLRAEKALGTTPTASAATVNRILMDVRTKQEAKDIADAAGGALMNSALTWETTIPFLRSVSSMKILLKGVMHEEDARLAVEYGVDGIVVSNHRGRQLDCVPATLELLPQIAEVVAGKIPLILDGGVRRGSDVFKAIALGADFVLVGRPVPWGLAYDGENGVSSVLNILERELSRTMALAGDEASIFEFTPPSGWMLEADQCVKRGVPDCPNNTYPDGDTYVSTLEAPGCPEGYLYHDSKCILRSSPACSGKTILEGDKCVSYAKPTCDGTAFEGVGCLSIKDAPVCPSGSVLNQEGQCVTTIQATCTPPSVYGDGRCVHGQPACQAGFVLTDDGCRSVDEPSCPDGKTMVKGTCVSIEKETYKPGYVLKDGQCVSALPPSCGENQVHNGTGCVGVMPDCPENTFFENGECVASNDPKCDANFVFNGKSCVAVKEPTCTEGHVYNAVTGECFTKAVPECQEDEILEDGRCKLVIAPCVEYKFCLAGAQGLLSGSGGPRKPAGDSKDKSQKPLAGKPSSSEDIKKGAPDGTQASNPIGDQITNDETAKRDTQAGKDSINLADKEQPETLTPPGAETNSGNTGTVPDQNVQVPDPGTIAKDGSGGIEKGAGADGSTEPQQSPSDEGEASYAGRGSGSGASGTAQDGAGREKGGRWIDYEEEIPDRRKLRKWIEDDDAGAHGSIPSGQGGTGGLPSGGHWKLDVDIGSLPEGIQKPAADIADNFSTRE